MSENGKIDGQEVLITKVEARGDDMVVTYDHIVEGQKKLLFNAGFTTGKYRECLPKAAQRPFDPF